MGKDFKSFYESKRDTKDTYSECNNNYSNTSEKNIEEELNQYKGKSEAELMQELFKIAGKSRNEGNLNNTDLEAFKDQISAFLTAEQNARLNMLIDQLKT